MVKHFYNFPGYILKFTLDTQINILSLQKERGKENWFPSVIKTMDSNPQMNYFNKEMENSIKDLTCTCSMPNPRHALAYY